MSDTTTATLGLIKPAPGSLDWALKLNGNQDTIDTMAPRVTALEGILGGAVAGVTKLPPGATWADLVTAFNNAPDNPAARHLIMLPNASIEQTAAIHWYKHVDLRGSGSASEIILRGNVSQFGASDAFILGAWVLHPINGLVFSDFKYSHDRASGGAGMRNNPFSIGDYTNNVMLKNLDYQDITANFIQILRNNVGPVRNIVIENINGHEWYEAIVILDGSDIDGVDIINVSGDTSAGSPLGGTSRPQGIFIGNEQMVLGLIRNVRVSGGTIDFRPMAGNNGQTLGVTLATGFQTGGTPGPLGEIWRYDSIHVHNVRVLHPDIGVRFQAHHGMWFGAALIADWELSAVEPDGNTYRDAYYLPNLHLTKSGTPTQVTGALGNATHFTRASTQYLFHTHDNLFNDGTHPTVNGLMLQGIVSLTSKPAGDMIIASKWNTTGNQRSYRLYWKQSTDRFVFEVSVDGTAVLAATMASAPSLATFYQVTGIVDEDNDIISISVNGGTPVTAALAGAGVPFVSTADFRIGADHQGNYWDGSIEKVRLFNWPDASKIVRMYNAGAFLTYQDLDELGGRTHSSVNGCYVDDATSECIVDQSGSDCYLDISDNECHVNAGQSGIGITGTFPDSGPYVVTSKPNRIIPRF